MMLFLGFSLFLLLRSSSFHSISLCRFTCVVSLDCSFGSYRVCLPVATKRVVTHTPCWIIPVLRPYLERSMVAQPDSIHRLSGTLNLEILNLKVNLESNSHLDILKSWTSWNFEILKMLKFRNIETLKISQIFHISKKINLELLDDTRTRVSRIGKVLCEVPTPAWDARVPIAVSVAAAEAVAVPP